MSYIYITANIMHILNLNKANMIKILTFNVENKFKNTHTYNTIAIKAIMTV